MGRRYFPLLMTLILVAFAGCRQTRAVPPATYTAEVMSVDES